MSQERDLELMEAGNAAISIEAAIKDLIDDQVRVKITGLLSIYRNGSIDHDMLVGGVAEIAALEGLLAELDSRARRGIAAANRELNSAEKTR